MLAFASQSLLRSASNAGSREPATPSSQTVDEEASNRTRLNARRDGTDFVCANAARHNAYEHGRPEVRPPGGGPARLQGAWMPLQP